MLDGCAAIELALSARQRGEAADLARSRRRYRHRNQ